MIKVLKKYYKALAVLCITIVLIGSYPLLNSKITPIPTLRVLNGYEKSIYSVEPTRINTIDEYNILRSLYGQLLYYDHNNELQLDVPSGVTWEGLDLVFKFGQPRKAIDGTLIGAEDAYLSLKRVMFLEKTGHGDLRKLLCPNHKLNHINDPCPGLKLDGDRLILTVHNSKLQPFLMPFLENVDMSIIPKSSIDWQSPALPIIDYKQTSGPYAVVEDSPVGEWVFAANPHHHFYDQKMPQKIQFVIQSKLGMFSNGSIIDKIALVDLIPTYIPIKASQAEEVKKTGKFNLHESYPIRVEMLIFTPKAVKDFTPAQRRHAAKLIVDQKIYLDPPYNAKRTVEFFQTLSDGTLDNGQKVELENLRSDKTYTTFKRPITTTIRPGRFEDYKNTFKNQSELQFTKRPTLSVLDLKPGDRGDYYYINNDTAWTENLGLLSYNFGVQFFHLPGLDPDKWLDDYINTEDKEERMKKLRKLHYEMLKEVVIYPFAVSPYIAFSAKPWTMNFSRYNAGIELWRMRYQP
ncbi:MAG: hypothetical protein ACOYOK_02105 [Pseudobdellovibrionaceae bacterium]